MQNNGIGLDEYVLFEAAVGVAPGQALLTIEKPSGSNENTPRDWYGQAILADDIGRHKSTEWTYHGRKVLERDDGYRSIEVEVMTLEAVLADLDRVDLVHMDIQYAEADVVESSLRVLEEKVARLLVGTHSVELHVRIHTELEERGWIKGWDFLPASTVKSSLGSVTLVDGVQSWRNPRLSQVPAAWSGTIRVMRTSQTVPNLDRANFMDKLRHYLRRNSSDLTGR